MRNTATPNVLRRNIRIIAAVVGVKTTPPNWASTRNILPAGLRAHLILMTVVMVQIMTRHGVPTSTLTHTVAVKSSKINPLARVKVSSLIPTIATSFIDAWAGERTPTWYTFSIAGRLLCGMRFTKLVIILMPLKAPVARQRLVPTLHLNHQLLLEVLKSRNSDLLRAAEEHHPLVPVNHPRVKLPRSPATRMNRVHRGQVQEEGRLLGIYHVRPRVFSGTLKIVTGFTGV